MAQQVPDSINFPKSEEEILKLWQRLDAFQTSLKQSKSRPRYSFYDGPPFATGLPHYGHILAGTIKDIVTRFAHQSGYHVERRFGWDCHGLPVEYEIDKTLGITGPEDVMKMGIRKYNSECRKIVMRYSEDWRTIITRLGRWIDFDHDYKTLYPWFMESIWWVFRQLYDKGLVYQGVKVMPYSTACNTPLSNFEANQNYKEVVDPAVIISFPLEDDVNVSLIAWTTTPWTLPSNLALCVNPKHTYVKVQDHSTERVYIMMEARLSALFKQEDQYTVIEKFLGSTLEKKRYTPLFPYFQSLTDRGAFSVCCDDYVTEESGTGVVHQAPYFGADDYRVCTRYGIITKVSDVVCPVDPSGNFTSEVTHFSGMYVKDADKHIVKHLKQNGRLVHQSTTKHSYPFCWRSETPLIYRAVPSWFIRVEELVENLLANNQETYWVPENVKDKRFANWLRDAHDWAVSRNRYWGTPIPLWVSDDGVEVVCIGSIEELQKLSGVVVEDLHRENIDHLTIPSKRPGMPPLKRISEVFDCWFESGSMPYAQVHYPFENRREFEDTFPADFIAEGIDQTRGWFYTLLVVSTALFDRPPFKNLIVNGLVLASDGQKMSKRKKNYPDPMGIINKHGADAMRLYLINSPVVRGDTLRFKEEGVRDILKDVFLPWYNAYRFLMQNVDRLHREEGMIFVYDESELKDSDNVMDRWILSATNSLVKFFKQEMSAYRLYTVVPCLVKFIDTLTNWYVRSNRKRLKGDGGVGDCVHALDTLFCVLITMCRLMAPFTPFLTELMYQNFKNLLPPSFHQGEDTASIHYLMLPKTSEQLIDTNIERAVQRMQATVELGRVIRDRKTLPTKYPLKEIIIIHQDEECLNDIQSLQAYIKEELNVKKVNVSRDKQRFGVRLKADLDFQLVGRRLKGDVKTVSAQMKTSTDGQLEEFQLSGELIVCGHTLSREDVKLSYTFSDNAGSLTSNYEAHSDGEIIVLLDISPDQSMLDEGVAREVINRMQKLRKKAGLVPADDITIYYSVKPARDRLADIIRTHSDFIIQTVRQPVLPFPKPTDGDHLIIEETAQLKGTDLLLSVFRGHLDQWKGTAAVSNQRSVVKPDTTPSSTGYTPVCRFVNVEDCTISLGGGAVGTVLLENPSGSYPISRTDLVKQVKVVLGLHGKKLKLSTSKQTFIDIGESLDTLQSQTLYVFND